MTGSFNNAAYELLSQELASLSLPAAGDSVAVFRPLNGHVDETYREALTQKLGMVFGSTKVTVGNAVKDGGIEVIIARGAGVRTKFAEIMSRDGEIER